MPAPAPLMAPRANGEPVTNFDELWDAVRAEDAKTTPTTIVIGGDIELTDTITIQDGQDITLVDDGEERTISHCAGSDFPAFIVQEEGELTLTASGEKSSLIIDGTNYSQSHTGYEKTVMAGAVLSYGEFTLERGIIQNYEMNRMRSGAVTAHGEKGHFIMNGGSIQDNVFTDQYGGIVKIAYGATFDMFGGEVHHNNSAPGGQINNGVIYI